MKEVVGDFLSETALSTTAITWTLPSTCQKTTVNPRSFHVLKKVKLLFYCEVLPMSYIIDQHTILFYKRLQTSENKVMRVLARINRDSVGACQNTVFILYRTLCLTLKK